MAEILKGKNKGKKVKLHQWCNNWASINIPPYIVSITNLKLDKSEIRAIIQHNNNGYLFEKFQLINDRFRRIK